MIYKRYKTYKTVSRAGYTCFVRMIAVLCAVFVFSQYLADAQVITNKGAFITVSSGVSVSSKNVLNNSGSVSNKGKILISGDYINAGITVGNNGFFILGGDWKNTGHFTSDNSTVLFRGNGIQLIKAGGYPFYNLSIDNTGGSVSMKDNVEVRGILSMSKGIVNAGESILYLSNPKISALNYDLKWGSRIIGLFERSIEETKGTYLFPLGTSDNYNPLKITPNTLEASGSLLSAFIEENPGNDTLPVPDPPVEIYETYPHAFWRLTAKNNFMSNDYDIDVTAAGFLVEGIPDIFFTSTGLLQREKGQPWSVSGHHEEADSVNKIIKRRNIDSGISVSGTEYALGRVRPLIIRQPVDMAVCETYNAVFTVEATGIQKLVYSWYTNISGAWKKISNDEHYSGARTSKLTISETYPDDTGDYFCTITDRNKKQVSSDTVHLQVNRIPVVSVTPEKQEHECSDVPFTDIVMSMSNNDDGSVFLWERTESPDIDTDMPTAGCWESDKNTLKGKFINRSDKPVTISFNITPKGPEPTECEGVTKTVSVTVNPIPRVIVADTTSRICNHDEKKIVLTTPTKMTQGKVLFDYELSYSGEPEDIAVSSNSEQDKENLENGTVINYRYENFTDTLHSVFFNITPKHQPTSDYRGCPSGVDVKAEVKVNPDPLRRYYISQPFNREENKGMITVELSKVAHPLTLILTRPWEDDYTATADENENEKNIEVNYEGAYPLTVTDSMGCKSEISRDDPSCIRIAEFETHIDTQGTTTCSYKKDGCVIFREVKDDSPPFTYHLVYNDTDTICTGELKSHEDYKKEENLAPGHYTLHVKNANEEENIEKFEIKAPLPIKVNAYDSVRISCHGYNDGSLWIESLDGGNGEYKYKWSTEDGYIPEGDMLRSSRLDGITAGTYFLTVTDKLGCEYRDAVSMSEPEGWELDDYNLSWGADTVYNISCNGEKDGFIKLSVSGDVGSHTYSWTGDGGFSADTKDIGGIGAGTYVLTAMDEKGCELRKKGGKPTIFTLTEPEPLTASIGLHDYNGYNIKCNGDVDFVDIAVAGGNEGAYQWEFYKDNVTSVMQSGDLPSDNGSVRIENLKAGHYGLSVSDAAGCKLDTSIVLEEPEILNAGLEPLHITCNFETMNDGSITLHPSGGAKPYRYLWSNGETTQDISGLVAGNYRVSMIDANGCETTDSAQINLPPEVKLSIDSVSFHRGYNISCNGQNDGFISVTVESGRSPYVFTWERNGEIVSDSEDVSGMPAGEYILTIVDDNRCRAADTILLTEPDKMEMIVVKSTSLDGNFNNNCAGDSTATIDIETVGTVGHVSYLWNDGFDGKDRENLPAGEYALTITDENGCTVRESIEITDPDPLTATVNIKKPFCPDISDGSIALAISGGIPDYNVRWSDNADIGNVKRNKIREGLYKVAVTDLNGCEITKLIDVKSENTSCLVAPNAISPNGDLINDEWNIANRDFYPNMQVSILNRWGQTVWKSDKGYHTPWDGRDSRGRPLPTDSYHYVINFGNGRPVQIGVISLIR